MDTYVILIIVKHNTINVHHVRCISNRRVMVQLSQQAGGRTDTVHQDYTGVLTL